MSIWKQNFTLKGLNELCEGNMGSHLGIYFFASGPDQLWAKMHVDDRTRQPMGLLHGGASVALAETMGSVASTLCLEDIERSTAVGIEINASHLRSVKAGFVTGLVKPVRIGNTLHVWEISVTDQRKKKICECRLTTMILRV